MRTPTQVAQRAIVMGAVAFRASLEVTDHPRTTEIAAQIPKWLATLDLTSAIDPIERELFRTPYGQLDESQRVDANWSGEGAALFCWTLGIGEQPPLFQVADHAAAVSTLQLMRPEARELLSAPSLRSDKELLEYCKTVRLIRVMLRETHVGGSDLDDETSQLTISIGRQRIRTELADFGIEIDDSDFEQTGHLIACAKPNERNSATGASIARDVAVTWLFDARTRYFEDG